MASCNAFGHYQPIWLNTEKGFWLLVLADDVGNTAAFLCSPLASAITGTVIYVDNGLHAMGLAVDSPCVAKATSAPSEKSSIPAWSFHFPVCTCLNLHGLFKRFLFTFLQNWELNERVSKISTIALIQITNLLRGHSQTAGQAPYDTLIFIRTLGSWGIDWQTAIWWLILGHLQQFHSCCLKSKQKEWAVLILQGWWCLLINTKR